MPKYEVAVNGHTYEVQSDRELSDYEAYTYAKQQAAADTPSIPSLKDFHATSIGPPVGIVDRLLNALPSLGGMAGGLIGGAGGSAFGIGFGGVPGGVAGATLGGATGEALRQTGRRILGGNRDVAQTPTDAAEHIGLQGAAQGGLELAGTGIMKGLGAAGEATLRGYLKPSLAARNLPKAPQIVQTAIDEALPVTAGGSAQAQRLIKDLRGQVDDVLQRTPGDVDLHAVAERVRAFAKAKYYKPGVPSSDFEAAMKVADSIDQHPAIANPFAPQSPAPVSASQANAVKRGIDTSIGEAQFGVTSGATKSAQKFARRDLRQELERLAPEIGPMNARESHLIDAAKAIERAVGREGNQSMTHGVKTLGAIAAGSVEYGRTHDPYQAAAEALAVRLALTPAVATRAAIVASRLGKMTGAIPANIARAAILAVSESQDQPEGVPDNTPQQ